MQENYTVLDEQKFLEKSRNFKGRKPAKLSTYKVFYPKTVALQNSIKNNVKSIETQPAAVNSEVNETPVVSQQVDTTPQAVPNEQPVQTPVEVKQEVNNVVNFPSKEVLEARMSQMDATIYTDKPGNNVVDITTYRRLRIGAPVFQSLENATDEIGIQPEMSKAIAKEEPKSEPPVDFSQYVNNISNFNVTPSNEPMEDKHKPNIDDYFKKDSIQADPIKDISVDDLAELTRDIQILNETIQSKKEEIREVNQETVELKRQLAEEAEYKKEEKLSLTAMYDDLSAQLEIAKQEKEKLMELKRQLAEEDTYGKSISA